MAQIIKHRRGSLEKLSEVTGSLQKGEIVLATGSANLTTTNGTALSFIVPESGSVQATNRFLMGSANPNIFSASTYNGMLKGVPYYASGSSTLFLLGSGANEAINLVGNIQPFSGSVNTRLGDLEASIGGGGSGIGTRVANLETISASYLAFTQSYYTDSASVATQFSASSASQTALSASIATTDSASAAYAASQLSSVSSSIATSFSASAAAQTSLSASVASVTGDFSSSVATSFSASAASVLALSTSVDSRLDSLEFNDTRFATTGSNTFIGTQVVTGSMYITNDLIVQGSSSLQNITASAVSIGTNTVVLNTATPAVRFGGISVADSGSGAGASGSLFWDSLNNNWIYQHPVGGAESAMSAILISGPKNSGSLGDEAHITPGRIMVAVGDDHIGDSIMSQSAGKITIDGKLSINDFSATFAIVGNSFSETYLESNGGLILQAGGSGVQVKSNSLKVDNDISSSTITGIGNVTLYSQSVDSRLDTIESSIGGGGSLGTRVSNLETISGSYLAFTQSYYTDSASFDTRISASVAGYTANSASAATSFSASLASQTALSASIATTNNTQTDNITTNSASAAGAFASASAYSGSAATSFSASLFTITANSASAATDFNTLSGSAFTQFSASVASVTANSASAATSFSASLATITANSASAATDFNTLSGSAFTQFSASAATATANSASAGTSISASNAQIAALSASVASTTGDFSGSIYTQFSASAFTATANSASAASDFNTLSGSAYTQFSASAATVTANSASAATSFSASLASQTALSASIATTNNGQTDRLGALESYSSSLKTAIELTGSNVTIQGDLLVRGTTTSVNSTTIQLGDNIIELNGTGATNGGLYVKDVTSPTTATGSLIWDSTNDYWKAGVKDTESKVLLAIGDNVFTSSIQTALSGTFGYSTFDTAISTSFSASNANIASLSSSVASVTGTFSSSVATSFSASAFTVTANSASAATSFSASLAAQTALSTSVDSRLDTLEGTGTIQGVGTTNNVSFSSVTASLNVPGGSSTKRLAFRGLTDNIEFIAAPTTAGDIAQWNGTDFVMSNTIDGGSF
jgi:trimeric autotransporter adhesin